MVWSAFLTGKAGGDGRVERAKLDRFDEVIAGAESQGLLRNNGIGEGSHHHNTRRTTQRSDFAQHLDAADVG